MSAGEAGRKRKSLRTLPQSLLLGYPAGPHQIEPDSPAEPRQPHLLFVPPCLLFVFSICYTCIPLIRLIASSLTDFFCSCPYILFTSSSVVRKKCPLSPVRVLWGPLFHLCRKQRCNLFRYNFQKYQEVQLKSLKLLKSSKEAEQELSPFVAIVRKG